MIRMPQIQDLQETVLRVTPVTILVASFALTMAYLIAHAIYSLYFHPLAGIPGPRLSVVTRIPWWINLVKGRPVPWIQALHRRYGPVVRFGPDDVSYADDGQSWKDIHGYERGRKENAKSKIFHTPPENGVDNITITDHEDHVRVRRLFQPAFSDRALNAQEPLFQRHIDLLISTLRKTGCEGGKPVEMVSMLTFTTFDIMGDLTFGQPLGLLENRELVPWVQSVLDSLRILPFLQMIAFYPLLRKAFTLIEPKWMQDMKRNHWNYSASRVTKRLERGSDEPDIWNLVLSAKEGRGLSLDEMHSNAELFMIAGSETTATSLSGLLYYLLSDRDKLQLLADELRGSFATSADITMERLARLSYLNACLQEVLRIYPALPVGSPRVVPEGGNVILGKWIPGGTQVSIHHYTISRSPSNFTDPDKFAPERWLGQDDKYKWDKREAAQPFSYGPRNCLGQNMALREMRLLLSKIIFNFDLEFADPRDEETWLDQNVYQVWEKKPLMCRVKAAG